LSAAISLVLRLVGREADPAKSREHVLLAVIAERRLLANMPADIAALMEDLETPPFGRIGALPMDRFMTKKARRDLAAALNSLLASPTFASWRQGATLGVADWLSPKNGRTSATIVSVAHLGDDERALVPGVLLEEVLSDVRGLPGSQSLRALVVFDEVYGFLPPHPAAPPHKKATGGAKVPDWTESNEVYGVPKARGAASPCVWRRRRHRDPEPDGPRLPGALERGCVVHWPAADRC